MDTSTLVAVTPGRTRTVFPLPDMDPDFSVTTRELGDDELAKIYGRHNYNPGRKDPHAMEKLTRVSREIVQLRVVGWANFTDRGQPIACEGKNKLLLYDRAVVIDAEEKTLWQLVLEAELAQKEAEQKNLLTPSPGTSAVASQLAIAASSRD